MSAAIWDEPADPAPDLSPYSAVAFPPCECAHCRGEREYEEALVAERLGKTMEGLAMKAQQILSNITCSCGGTMVWDGSKYVCSRCGATN